MNIVDNYLRMQAREQARERYYTNQRKLEALSRGEGRTYTMMDNYRVMQEKEELKRQMREDWQRMF